MPTLSLSNSKNDFRQGDSGSTNRGKWLCWINRGGDLGHWQFPSWQCSQESEEVVGWGRVTLSISLSVFPSKCSHRFSTSLFPSLSLSVFFSRFSSVVSLEAGWAINSRPVQGNLARLSVVLKQTL